MPQQVILDPGQDRCRGSQRPGATLSGSQIESLDAVAQDELKQWRTSSHQFPDCVVAITQSQIAGVQTISGDRHVSAASELLIFLIRPQRSLTTRLIPIEGKHHLSVAVIEQQPPQHLHMPVTKGSATGGNGGADPSQVASHHIGIALDDHHLLLFGDVFAGLVGAEQHVALLVDQRLRRVQVLRSAFFSQPSSPEPHNVTR